MAISFSLNLSPNQIEFLQQLDLYADGHLNILDVGLSIDMQSHFVTNIKRLIREGLVEHIIPKEGERYEGGKGNGLIIKSYKITEKGRTVLGLIQSDIEAFLSRQKSYKQTKAKGRKGA